MLFCSNPPNILQLGNGEKQDEREVRHSVSCYQGTALLHLPWHLLCEKFQKINFPMEELISYQNLKLANFLVSKSSRKGNFKGCPCSHHARQVGSRLGKSACSKRRRCWMWLFLLYQDQAYLAITSSGVGINIYIYSKYCKYVLE